MDKKKIDNSPANPKMFELAKKEGEPLFVEVIKKSIYEPIDIALGTEDDDKKRHFDIKMLEYDGFAKTNMWHYVDVKDVEEQNFDSGNYVLKKSFLEFHMYIRPYGYYTAFHLIEDGKRSRKFILVDTQEMLSKCHRIDKGSFELVSLIEVMHNCDYRRIEEEQI